jgi:phospholipid/cholesterol/gamma-HCH transport system substrate-binding protein
VVEIVPSSILGGQYVSIDAGDPELPVVSSEQLLKGSPPLNLIDEATEIVQQLRAALTEEGILDNLKGTMQNLNSVTAKLDSGEGTLGKLLADDEVHQDIQRITDNLRDVSDRLSKGDSTLGKLLSEDDQVYTDLAEVTANLKEISDRLSSGEGTLGKLMSEDATLYREAELLLQEVRAALDDMREASPLTTFSSVFFGAF